jgi:hypothetical protein
VWACAERAYFAFCAAFGRALRAGKYSRAVVFERDGQLRVRKRRLCYAPLLVWLGEPLVRLLNTGVRVLRQRHWEEQERLLYRTLYRDTIEVDGAGTLILPHLAGEPLASIVSDPTTTEEGRRKAIALSVAALAEFHRLGFSHGDAMAENVLVDGTAGVARWFDFETVHDPNRPMRWRCADDLRALLATCLLRSRPESVAATLHLVLDVYDDDAVADLLAASFTPVFQRALAFRLAQANLPFERFREIARLLAARRGQTAVLLSRDRLASR